MKAKTLRILVTTSVLVLVLLAVFGQENVAYGRGRGLSYARYLMLPAPARGAAVEAKAALARKLRLSSDRIAVLDVKGVTFPDTSLGVIEPGARYREVVTPGYVVRLSVDGQTYTYHGSGGRAVLVPIGDERQHLLRSSVADLRVRTNLGLDQVVVQRIAPTEFPDGSLGAPEPNVPYPLGPTPGYEIRIQAGGVVYRYWAAGERVVYVGSFLEPGQMG
jgi:hypothetical protein